MHNVFQENAFIIISLLENYQFIAALFFVFLEFYDSVHVFCVKLTTLCIFVFCIFERLELSNEYNEKNDFFI